MRTELQSPMATGIKAYLAHKRALGKQLEKAESVFRLLDRHLLEHRVREVGDITPALLNDFVRSRPRHTPRSFNVLLSTLRGLFEWLVRRDVLATSPLNIPPQRVTPGRSPFLFNADQAKRLFDAARNLRRNPRIPERGEIYRMIFVLLYGLGLRVGEVSRLCRKDVDLDNRFLVIRQTKFGKNRLVPFGPKMAQEITQYLQREEGSRRIPTDCPLFSFDKDKQKSIRPERISQTFHSLLPALDLIIPAGVAPPHLHCLRHSFAVGTLLRWYRDGLDATARLLDLSTFLGHVSLSSTAVYLTITTELLEYASQRFAHYAAPAFKELES
jgi:site-specific recombinase XerD